LKENQKGELPMINKKMLDAFNGQINAELYSAYLYLSMAAHFKSANLPGFANWMTVQTQEEVMHAMKFYNYVLSRGGKVKLTAIDGPPVNWKSPLEVFEHVYEHEQKVTGLINGLMNLAIAEKDHAANTFLQWFVNEQVEEEANADALVRQLKMAKDAPGAIFMIDRELAKRVFEPAGDEGGSE
jgi:ferritin